MELILLLHDILNEMLVLLQSLSFETHCWQKTTQMCKKYLLLVSVH